LNSNHEQAKKQPQGGKNGGWVWVSINSKGCQSLTFGIFKRMIH